MKDAVRENTLSEEAKNILNKIKKVKNSRHRKNILQNE